MSDTSRIACKIVLSSPLTVLRNADTIAAVRRAIDEERARCLQIAEYEAEVWGYKDGSSARVVATRIRNGRGE
jgi:hypothetical protein